MLHKLVCKPHEAFPSLFQKASDVSGQMGTIDLRALAESDTADLGHTLNTLGRKQRQPTKRIALVQAVEQPYKVAKPSYDTGPFARCLDLVIVVLEQEHAFFLW